jgi:hypothetical protein
MSVIRFGIIGGGWRAEFYLRIAQALPEHFQVAGVLVRDPEKGAKLTQKWGVPSYPDLESFLAHCGYSFVVVSVPWAASPGYLAELSARGMPVLAETPPAPDIAALSELYRTVGGAARIQVAEQYLYQPQHAARIALARSGKLGTVSQALVSAAHGYHGISLIRHLLGVRFEDAEISGFSFVSPLVGGPNRDKPPVEGEIIDSKQDIAYLRFGERLGVFDFAQGQYFSWIRRNRIVVRGNQGEIVDDEVAYLEDYQTPVFYKLNRIDTGQDGNLEDYHHRGIMGGGQWLYRNPFGGGRLSDDELAIATSLYKMGDYAAGGPSFYSLGEASQDHYLSILMHQAIETGQKVISKAQMWTVE